ncbi:MAG: type II secretion system F family protein [Thermodesulfovibrionales bacterium]
MPVFKYKGYDREGKTVNGSIESSGLNEAIARIRESGVFPAEVKNENYSPSIYQRLVDSAPSFLANMTRQLSILLSSGVPLVEALQSLSREERGYFKSILLSIKEKVSSGASLNKALDDFREVFPEFYIQMVRAGEESGTLDKVLQRLADFLNKREEMKSRVRSAMIYPLIMIGVSVIVLSFLFTFVIPRIIKIFNDTKAVLPVLTKMMIFVSNIFISYWWLLLISLVAISFATRWLVKRERMFIDRMLLKLPGNILKSLYYSRFARIMSFLLEGGLPLLKTLDIASGVTGNSYLASLIREARQRVAGGQGLSSSLEVLPPVFLQLIATGEKSGSLGEAFNNAADSYEEEFTRGINRMISILEPAIILTMGLIVGLIVAAILLPMLQLNQLIRL